MKVKSRNLVELIWSIIVLISMFIPRFYVEEKWVNDYEYSKVVGYIPVQKLDYSRSGSFFDIAGNTNMMGMILTFVSIALIFCSIVSFIIQFIGKDKRQNWLPTLTITVSAFVMFIICSIFIGIQEYNIGDSEYRCKMDVIFFISLALFIGLLTLTIIGYLLTEKRGIIDEELINKNHTTSFNTSDELFQLKNLLDSGIITQEEFEAKKQLLGL